MLSGQNCWLCVQVYCPTTDTWTLLAPRLAGPVYRGRACLVDWYLVR